MADRLTDADLVMRLKTRAELGNEKAAAKFGCQLSAFRASLQEARKRGLTASTPVLTELDKTKAKVKTLEAALRSAQQEQESAEAIRREIFKIAAYDPEPPTWLTQSGKLGSRGMPTYFGSDWHYGEVVRNAEVGGVNEFNSEIAAERIRRGAETTVDLAYNHMGRAKTIYPGIVFALGGDLMSGDIHEELMVTNDRTPQQCVNELTDLIAANIELFAGKFGRVFVPCVTGNHGRSTRKPRLKGRVWTSTEWNIYCNLVRYFKNDKRIAFKIADGADIRYSIYNHRYLLTHGDNLGVRGGDGIIGALGPIMRGSIKIRNSESQIGQDFDTVMMGHWHQYITLPGLIVNNSLKGLDEFAHLALRAPYSRPSQALWFTHPEHGITAHWQVYLEPPRNKQAKPKLLSWEA